MALPFRVTSYAVTSYAVTSFAVTSFAVRNILSSPAERASSPVLRTSSPRLPLRKDVSRLLPSQHFIDEVFQLGAESVARRDHAHGPAVFHHRNVAEPALVHEVQGIRERLVRMDRLRLPGHDLGKLRRSRVAIFGHHAEHYVA